MSQPNPASTVPSSLPSGADVAPPASTAPASGTASTTTPPPAKGPTFDTPPAASSSAPAGAGVPPASHAAGEAGEAGAHGGILQQARDMAKPYLEQVDKTARPYLEKAQASAKPYTDAAMAKGQEIKEYLEGKNHPDHHKTQTEGDIAGIGGTGIADTRAAAGSPPAEPGTYPAAPPQSLGHKALGMFDYGLVSVKSALNTLGNTIDNKTATPEKPGLYTQASTVASKGLASIQKAVGEPSAGAGAGSAVGAGAGVGAAAGASTGATTGATVTAATGSGAAVPPTTATGASAANPHPVMTTTNTIAHNSKDGDPVV
ncbi:hypothetical protein CC85DRAFT_330386 [Cutaneotrichosporon oleaginosum]|uniref:Uncharacterized protein n=1 Tax=Cutaneotrichosporon oleaginosum TaxID=879819 RepID=A0A0J0XFH7_9TREE|nr:uncharacterized protein CC85DRAFT_330386 [Cutaneotrichosporon oleaginosum]KLT39850.1 hypothetical protein CC85DRAFT_330386 [Cutaneotrichosporon oleaginosum]TXT05447.1 hypothetical protein COLE_06767 [Cutaneotrichosporon oleaginosum]